jgi:hypothetical protein
MLRGRELQCKVLDGLLAQMGPSGRDALPRGDRAAPRSRIAVHLARAYLL